MQLQKHQLYKNQTMFGWFFTGEKMLVSSYDSMSNTLTPLFFIHLAGFNNFFYLISLNNK